MILGLSSYTFGWSVGIPGSMPSMPMTEHDLIDRTLEAGLSCLQIGDNLPLHTFPQKRLDGLRARVGEEKIRLEVGARKLTNDTSETPAWAYVSTVSTHSVPVKELTMYLKSLRRIRSIFMLRTTLLSVFRTKWDLLFRDVRREKV